MCTIFLFHTVSQLYRLSPSVFFQVFAVLADIQGSSFLRLVRVALAGIKVSILYILHFYITGTRSWKVRITNVPTFTNCMKHRRIVNRTLLTT